MFFAASRTTGSTATSTTIWLSGPSICLTSRSVYAINSIDTDERQTPRGPEHHPDGNPEGQVLRRHQGDRPDASRALALHPIEEGGDRDGQEPLRARRLREVQGEEARHRVHVRPGFQDQPVERRRGGPGVPAWMASPPVLLEGLDEGRVREVRRQPPCF